MNDGNDGHDLSRRDILAVAAAGVAGATLAPLTLHAAAPRTGRGAPGAGAPEATPVTGKTVAGADGWLATVKPAEIADNTFRPISDQPIVLARKGDQVYALSTRCTHKGCAVKPQPANAVPPGKDPELVCPCHQSHFSLTGADVKGPNGAAPTLRPLARYALRLNKDGLIEVNSSAPVDGQGADTVVTLKNAT